MHASARQNHVVHPRPVLEDFVPPPPHKTPILKKVLSSFFFIYITEPHSLSYLGFAWFRTYVCWLCIGGAKKMSFCHKLEIIIPAYVQPNVVDTWYFKLWILSGFKETGIRKFEFVTKI